MPPLEGFWWQGERRPGTPCCEPTEPAGETEYPELIMLVREDFKWISVIRLPDFVTREDFDWAVRKATAKKKQDFSKVEFFPMRRAYVYSVCISERMTMSLLR